MKPEQENPLPYAPPSQVSGKEKIIQPLFTNEELTPKSPSDDILKAIDSDKPAEHPVPPAPTPQSGDQPAYYGMAASQMRTPEPKKRLPLGLYGVSGLLAVGGVIGLASPSTDIIRTIDSVIALLLAFGLFFGIEAIRKVAIAVLSLMVIVTIVVILGFGMTQSRLNERAEQANTAFEKVQSQGSAQQKQAVGQLLEKLNKEKEAVTKKLSEAMVFQGLQILIMTTAIVYLSLPKVKAAFKED